ncbi:phosphatidylinositol/phosphatidylcholine transfer protein [Marchantia polymorpha subsp. ruderalis]|uniref:CRAL-TRIO domain-containing protein n=1 Tax=Marchantia polymorpha TaxID=3197 RepID=A0A2R6X871_MARPO|nr:hypothetical protein MARPO_0030s0043 [Marchantia polymorpha]PTQ42298.1 hypothetical protein MARPO_0030s0043 [Marchantia polymorpha]BBN20181.1 hypothetical protein Mp_8g17100 [Marchantia polymorpha subsp. ruderalis]BBN20182.1 hypothetical protein Mp_8g17100 [Marchantia polymorpha subsp. ruderalis]|eukprot:PTQ42297.1 hypothetical protein MARPO_0030s0043 [Marchantia polymorpha]
MDVISRDARMQASRVEESQAITKESIRQMQEFVDGVDQKLQASYRNVHQGYPDATLERFLKARDGNVQKANKMLLDCLNWRVSNEIDNILAKPIEPKGLYDSIRNSQLIGVSGYCRKGRPVYAIGVGLSGYDKAQVDKYVQSHIQINEYRDRVLLPEASKRLGRPVGSCIKILDMTGLKLSALSRVKILTVISTVDDLNYPEKTDTYYIVNAPYVFTACWKAVKPLLQERTKKKVQVLKGCGREELLEVMDLSAIPLFARGNGTKDVNGSMGTLDCFSPNHKFHVDLWNYMKDQAEALAAVSARPQGSVHVTVPSWEEPEVGGSAEVVHMIEETMEKLAAEQNGKDPDQLLNGLSSLKMQDIPTGPKRSESLPNFPNQGTRY